MTKLTMTRHTIGRIHLSAAILGLTLIAVFWSSTIVVELFADAAAVATLKQAILWGMLALSPQWPRRAPPDSGSGAAAALR